MSKNKWTFWIDCGGTFTDIVAINDSGEHRVHKLLSHSSHYESAVVQGISDIVGHTDFKSSVAEVRLGTTVATNAFLERSGVECALITTLGHKDLLGIRNQSRPDLFELDINKTPPLYSFVTHIKGRMDSKGEEVVELDEEIARFELQRILDRGIKSVAISLMHSTVNPAHELKVWEIAKDMGFSYISLSHQVSPIAKYIPRTETAVIDAYLSPYLRQYTEYLENKLQIPNIYYMQSDGGLCSGSELKGYNALLSGPAGGLIGAIDVARSMGHSKLITFDMGGTSTDVAIYDQELSIDPSPDFYGLKLLCPMVDIHTVAAGGGSILKYDNGRFQVGPESAGSTPGPACYRNGGPLTVTDANLYLDRLEADKFPHIFGPNQDRPLDLEIVDKKFKELEDKVGMPAKEIAQGFLDVAVESMSRAIRKVSIERGQDPKDFCLVSFGGAAGQLALKVAQTLSMSEVIIHPLSSVLSAYGIGKAQHQMSFQGRSESDFKELESKAKENFPFKNPTLHKHYLLKAKGSDHEVEISADDQEKAFEKFRNYHQKTFGHPAKEIECEAVKLQITSKDFKELQIHADSKEIEGPSIISENNTSIVVESGWQGQRQDDGLWVLRSHNANSTQKRDPKIELEIFYQRFQFIAEQMGTTLQRLAASINIKERNDFSCALFTRDCELIANAPHIPVHLGSMDRAVRAVNETCDVSPGESYILNSPVCGGTHLPDVTIITPVFSEDELIMWVASRGHHADIGGIAPGSMPGNSKSLKEEGVVITPTKIFANGELDLPLLKKILQDSTYPVRNFDMNLHDIEAKISANHKGVSEIIQLAKQYGAQYLEQMSERILDYTHQKIVSILNEFKSSETEKVINSKRKLKVKMQREGEKTVFDFTGSSGLLGTNFNAPVPVVQASVMFSLRSMIEENIPLNSGLMRAIELKVPQDSMLNPGEDSPVVAGNVETSQAICDLIFQAMGVKANSYGSMNNLSFGNDEFQYYETICGGSGATASAHGASAVQVNMTNSLLTDPEVFETRLPVRIELMGIRHGSGGAGMNHGGNGVYRKLLFLSDVKINMITQSREVPPSGIKGGTKAQRGMNLLEVDGEWIELPECFEKEISANTRLCVCTPGGGGYGERKKETKHLVFGFGSNMDLAQIKKRCPSSELVRRGTVNDREIRYTRYSPVRKGGVADMYNAPGHYVYGLVVSMNDEDLTFLDDIECAQNGYQRIETKAFDDNGEEFICHSYDVIDKKPDIAPTKVYEWLVYSGAYNLGANQNYLDRLQLAGHVR